MNIFLIIGALLFLLILIYKPKLIAILLFSITIAGINLEIPGAPLNLRALVTMAIFGRILFDKDFSFHFKSFVGISGSRIFLLFMAIILLISAFHDLYSFDLLKLVFSTTIAGFCAYYFYAIEDSDNLLKTSLLIAGLLCFADLAYTYIFVGSMPIIRLYELFTNTQMHITETNTGDEILGSTNHNFFGQICGMCLVYFFCDYLNNHKNGVFKLLILPVMFLSVLMSTSRSALVAVLIVMLLLGLSTINIKTKKRNLARLTMFAAVASIIVLLLFWLFGHFLNLEGKFVEEITYRLIEEPVAIFQKAFGLNYNIQNLDSGEWRVQASANAFQAFLDLPSLEQFFGIGYGGFSARNMGAGLNAHNGLLLILIEFGIFGLLLYLLLVLGVIWKSIRLRNISPTLSVLIFILFYGINQNNELTQATTFLFVFSLIAEVSSLYDHHKMIYNSTNNVFPIKHS